ncbi:fatty acid desaturase family protein, partial [Spirochaetota bacterium]
MNFKVKYSNNVHADFSKTVKKRVSQFLKENPGPQLVSLEMAIKGIIMLALYFTPYILIVLGMFQPWAIILLFFIMGIGKAGLGMNVMHDAIHNSFSKNRFLNKVLSTSIYLLGGNIFNWKVQHNHLHHWHTNVFGIDEDIDTKFLLRFSPYAELKPIHRYQKIYAFFFYSMVTLSFVFQDLEQLFRFKKKGLITESKTTFGKQLLILLLNKLLYLILVLAIPIVLVPVPWWYIVIGFFIMHFTAGIILSITFQLAHQVEGVIQNMPSGDSVIDHSYMSHQLFVTADYCPQNKILAWFIGGLNF